MLVYQRVWTVWSEAPVAVQELIQPMLLHSDQSEVPAPSFRWNLGNQGPQRRCVDRHFHNDWM
jgi:hypothetical protein